MIECLVNCLRNNGDALDAYTYVKNEKYTEEHLPSEKYLSQLITLGGSENFSSYINRFRVEEAKQMLCNSTFDKYNIESID